MARLLRATDREQLLSSVLGLLLDIDNTLYRHPAYHASGTRGEIAEIGKILEQSHDQVEALISGRKKEIAIRQGRPATMTESVLSLGVTRQQWNELRCRAWQPERWLEQDPQVCEILARLSNRYCIAFGTNSPLAVGRRVLTTIGVSGALPDAPVFGPESFAVSKLDPVFFKEIAGELGLTPCECISIGDREEADGTPAITAGYADALILSGSRDELVMVLPELFVCR